MNLIAYFTALNCFYSNFVDIFGSKAMILSSIDRSDDLITWFSIVGCSVIFPKLFSFENNAYKLICLALSSLSLPLEFVLRIGVNLSNRDWEIDCYGFYTFELKDCFLNKDCSFKKGF
jgi:hypothetical protein